VNPLRVRWLGTVPYREAWSLQRALHDRPGGPDGPTDDHLLLLEHPHTYTLGRNADADHVLVEPSSVGAELVAVDRGGDVTYHGPGQLVAYPIVSLDPSPRTKDYVRLLEDVLIDVVRGLGLDGVGRHDGYPGVWVEPNTAAARKVAQIGVRVERARTLHGVSLNVAPDMAYFGHIVPCGIAEYGVTSLAQEGVDVAMRDVVDAFADAFVARWSERAAGLGIGPVEVDRADVVRRRPVAPGQAPDDSDLAPFSRGLGPGERTTGANATVGAARSNGAAPASGPASDGTSVRLLGRLAEAGVTQAVALTDRKPDWMRAPVRHGADVLGVKRTVRGLGLITVCEEAGCPNLSECWSEGTATFMVCGERCTRACGFCLVDTRHPEPLQPDEPDRVAEAVARMGLSYAVITMVARDDLPDGGAAHVAATVRAIRDRRPGTSVEVLISDLKGDAEALDVVLTAEPDVVNHNVETVARLQRAVRPSAGYARSLALLGRAALAGRTTKSGLIVGLGETEDEIAATLADLAAVGVQIVTIGQYLRPTSHHLPVARWWTPEDFERFAEIGRSLGLAHVESSPFTRSSYHARGAAEAAVPVALA
jgi:lipoic acid synthetase